MRIKTIYRLILVFILFFALQVSGRASDEHIYSTWDELELDTCASAWLIKRFVDPQTEFKFYPKGALIAEGVPFDTPDAELRRRQGMSTFESIIGKYKIKDERTAEIGKLIHEIEINYWAGAYSTEGKELDEKIKGIIDRNKCPQKILEESFRVIDALYEKANAK